VFWTSKALRQGNLSNLSNLSIDSAGVMNTHSEWIALLLMALLVVAFMSIASGAG
jgi:hypothetical protein